MYHKHNTKGIVISGRTEGDSNKSLIVFTERFGLISAKAQGARNMRSKMRGGLQEFSLAEFSLVQGRNGWKIVSVRTKKNFFENLRTFPERLKIAANVLSLIKKLVAEEKTLNLFDIVANFFSFLEKAKESEIVLAECLTMVRILHSLGYMRNDPELSMPISSSEIQMHDLETIAPKRMKIIKLINESLKAA